MPTELQHRSSEAWAWLEGPGVIQRHEQWLGMKEALEEIRGWREIGRADTPREKLTAIEEICDAALSKARGIDTTETD